MKRESFLWSLTYAHEYGLMIAKSIQEALKKDLDQKELGKLKAKVKKFFQEDMTAHIGIEEHVLVQLAFHVGPKNPLLKRARREHLELSGLLRKWDLRRMRLFSEKLTKHIYFEEDELFPKIEEQFTSAEKEWVESDMRFNIHNWRKMRRFPGGGRSGAKNNGKL